MWDDSSIAAAVVVPSILVAGARSFTACGCSGFSGVSAVRTCACSCALFAVAVARSQADLCRGRLLTGRHAAGLWCYKFGSCGALAASTGRTPQAAKTRRRRPAQEAGV
jgi:hypothetical protein